VTKLANDGMFVPKDVLAIPFIYAKSSCSCCSSKEAGGRDVAVIPTPFQEAIATKPSAYRYRR
jgi:hypothetical protein